MTNVLNFGPELDAVNTSTATTLQVVNQIRASQLADEKTAASNQTQLVNLLNQLQANQQTILGQLAAISATLQAISTAQQSLTSLLNQVIEILQDHPSKVVGDPKSVIEVHQPLPPP